jgi:hypothetical protein
MMPAAPKDERTMTKAEYDAYVSEHGYPPGDAPSPAEKHRMARNMSLGHVHHSRGT